MSGAAPNTIPTDVTDVTDVGVTRCKTKSSTSLRPMSPMSPMLPMLPMWPFSPASYHQFVRGSRAMPADFLEMLHGFYMAAVVNQPYHYRINPNRECQAKL